ncbi:PDZ domain-containing protein [Pseudidiomarina sp. GXY010]|uniref:PDZ domain-containing protein n=1 Tax=Pseudidiomarina fusca TaxID=2965078 RepID=A0ABU3KVB8_9GAMM|nr:PDZ domain-containing protein [Pseudidiomarina sp. GXY010]MDT7524952.1 PDZ domain-containing protein [Pseudidiomarina sp. GXY010]
MLQYRICVDNAAAHQFRVALDIPVTGPGALTLRLPAWIPGSYMIRDFARNLSKVTAHQSGHAVAIDLVDKQSWRIFPQQAGTVTVEYQVYAFDLSVRSAYLDQFFGFYNHSSLCLEVVELSEEPCQVAVSVPAGWRLATGMPRLSGSHFAAGEFRAENYQALIDYPVLMGPLNIHEFIAGGVKHALVLAGREFADSERICADLAAICEYQIAMFGHQPPFQQYLFLTMVVGKGFGGLEHSNSTALLCSRKDLAKPNKAVIDNDYRTFLSLCSHEYFHSWNVKTLKPREFLPYQLQQEQYTKQLWFYEGITSYYDDYVLHQAGLIDQATYLTLLGDTIARVYRAAGVTKQSVAESSFYAWTKFYKQDENSPNSIVSYYAKGALIALCLDLKIRLASQHQLNLGLVLKDFWQAYGATSLGTEETTFVDFVNQQYAIQLAGFIDAAVYGTSELPLAELLAEFGVSLLTAASADDNSVVGKAVTPTHSVSLGAKYKATGAGLELQTVYEHEAAQQAGLSALDRVIAIDNLQVTDATLKEMFERYQPGQTVTVHAFRRDELFSTELTWQAPLQHNKVLKVTNPQLLQGWLC